MDKPAPEQAVIQSAPKRKSITLALQGGAALGAFGWGVLDELLSDPRLKIEGVAGTSSGAINAALLTYGLINQDPSKTQQLLGNFWRRLSETCEERRWSGNMLMRILRPKSMRLAQKQSLFDLMSRILLPYQFDAATMQPLRGVIEEMIDFPRLQNEVTIKLFVNATNIKTIKNKIFARPNVTIDALCASCCLPFLFDAVAIDGEAYWDGGYLGNPTIYPLIYECDSTDIVLVLTSPIAPKSHPERSSEIISRISEVSFTSSLMREMRAIAFVTDLLERGMIKKEAGMRKINIHVIAPPDLSLDDFSSDHHFNADWSYMVKLRDKGQKAAKHWLGQSFDKIGSESSFDIHSVFV